MWTALEPWQVAQLERLSTVDRDRVESALNTLWEARPDLLSEITISALDQAQVTLERTSQILDIPESEVASRLAEFRRRALKRSYVVVCDGSVAKLADGGLPVWEVVRVYRRLGSVEKLREAFGLSVQTLESALAYADVNAAEINQQIDRYEALLEKRKAEYPFAR
jgi:hypothetical protein